MAKVGEAMTDSTRLAIETLIRPCPPRRLQERGQRLRRVDELWAGNLKSTLSLIAGLPAALEVPHEVIADALRQTEHNSPI